ncbi:TPA: GntR family transcriptional regulator [Streptococcus agalactiae]
MLPAYIKIHDAIKKEIDKGTWKIGQRLPSERDLADDYSVSRMTLRQSITLLVEEGILERRVGSGTYVASHRVQEKMRGTTSFTEIVNSQGRKPSSKLISFQRKLANETEIQKLNLSHIPENLIKGFEQSEVTEHFFKTLTENGYEIGKSQQTIYARNASERVASHLEVNAGHAILALTQVSYFTDGKPFEYVHGQYVGDRFEFYLENN